MNGTSYMQCSRCLGPMEEILFPGPHGEDESYHECASDACRVVARASDQASKAYDDACDAVAKAFGCYDGTLIDAALGITQG